MVPNLAVPSFVRILCLLLFSLVHLACCLGSFGFCCCCCCCCNKLSHSNGTESGGQCCCCFVDGDDCDESVAVVEAVIFVVAVVVFAVSSDECDIFCLLCLLWLNSLSLTFFHNKQKSKNKTKQNNTFQKQNSAQKKIEREVFACNYIEKSKYQGTHTQPRYKMSLCAHITHQL